MRLPPSGPARPPPASSGTRHLTPRQRAAAGSTAFSSPPGPIRPRNSAPPEPNMSTLISRRWRAPLSRSRSMWTDNIMETRRHSSRLRPTYATRASRLQNTLRCRRSTHGARQSSLSSDVTPEPSQAGQAIVPAPHRPRSGACRGTLPRSAQAGCPPQFRGLALRAGDGFFSVTTRTRGHGDLRLVVMETIKFNGRRLSAIFSELSCISLDYRHQGSRQQENDRSDG